MIEQLAVAALDIGRFDIAKVRLSHLELVVHVFF